MRIVCVHQGYELYGSDRCFIDSVSALRSAWPLADIEVVLPQDGPIVPALQKLATRVTIEPLFILRRRGFAKLLALSPLRLPAALWRAARRMRRAQLVLVNTVVVLDYMLLARFFSLKTLVHVHEIPDGAKLRLFRALLAWTNADVIFNSNATRVAYRLRNQTQHTVYNGITPPSELPPAADYDRQRPLRLLMMGRINRIKGQDLLIEAIAKLPRDIVNRLEVRIVGGTFENDNAREESLRLAVHAAGLDAIVRFEPFIDDPAALYQWADLVVMPSRLPESLGRVAIEAMAYGRAVLASRIGGLAEIVEDNVTGWLIAPNDAKALSDAILRVVTLPELWRTYGEAGRRRMEAMFSSRAIDRQLQSIFRAHVASVNDATVRGAVRA
jgi:glycosyltransferase involved in cell wall biosynthesis